MATLATSPDGLRILKGNDSPVASHDVAGVVKPGPDFDIGTDGTLSIATTYDPVVTGNGKPAIGGRVGQDYLDADTGNLYTYGEASPDDPTNNPTK